MMTYNDEKIKGLFTRVYNDKMIADKTKGISDEKDIAAYCQKVFGQDGRTPDPSLLHQFNNVLVETADEIAKPRVTSMFNILANVQQRKPGDLVMYEVPTKAKARMKWAALGTGVDLVRVEGGKKTLAVPQVLQTGFYYEPLDLVQDSVKNFRALVNQVADAKVKLYLNKIAELTSKAIESGGIPAKNIKTGSGLKIADYDKLASVLGRYGGRPIFVADTLMIDYFARQQVTDAEFGKFATDQLKSEVWESLNVTKIGRTVAVNLVNPFADDAHTKTELPVNEGYMFAGGSNANRKPFYVVEYGGMRQLSEQDPEDLRIKVKIYQEAAIEMLFGQLVGYIKDDSIML
jgi:hypothetical protein